MRLALALVTGSLAGCAMGADLGVLSQPVPTPKGASGTAHLGFGGGGTRHAPFLLGLGLDTRVDVASGGSRWTLGASALGGVRLGPIYATGRVGVWRAILSGASEAGAVPSFEIGGYVPRSERYDKDHPQYGNSAEGISFGIRDDIDTLNYVTVFIGYALFISPGY